MKKKLLLILGGIFIVLFVLVASYFWYLYFLDLGSDGTLGKKDKNLSSLTLVDQNKLYATYTEGMEIYDNAPGYRFQVINSGLRTAKYRLQLVEIEPSKINDGCTPSSLLKQNELNYQLYFNNQIIKEGNLADLEGDIIDEQEISIDVTNNYELKIWVNSSATNYEGKHYHYKVDIEVVE